ncbi:hypothetical protein BZA77DRAFT_307501 [Pyronema omphalodes]|nr:hypothetical protein BZA77DRAFT_307501 [Pyronema omphalodes]
MYRQHTQHLSTGFIIIQLVHNHNPRKTRVVVRTPPKKELFIKTVCMATWALEHLSTRALEHISFSLPMFKRKKNSKFQMKCTGAMTTPFKKAEINPSHYFYPPLRVIRNLSGRCMANVGHTLGAHTALVLVACVLYSMLPPDIFFGFAISYGDGDDDGGRECLVSAGYESS